LADLIWATPFDIVTLAVIWTRAAAEAKPSILLPQNEMVRGYLVDVGMADHVRASWGPGGGSLVEPPLVRLTRLHSGYDWGDHLKGLWPQVRSALGDFQAARRTLDIMSGRVRRRSSQADAL